MSIRIDDLVTFLAIVRLGSFTAAAGQMHVTQSAVTRRMAELETRLGATLFERGAKRATLTVDGRTCLDYVQQIVSIESRMRYALGKPHRQVGTVRIGAGETVAMWWLPQFAQRVSRLYPGITLELDVDLSERHIHRFEHGELDLLFLPGKPPQQGRRLLLDDLSFSWMASPRLGVPNRTLSATELAAWPLLTLSTQSNNHIMVMDWLARSKVKPSRVDICNSLSLAANLVLAGMGVAMLPTVLFQDSLKAGTLQRVLTQPPLPPIPLWVVHQEESGLPLNELAEIASQVHRHAAEQG